MLRYSVFTSRCLLSATVPNLVDEIKYQFPGAMVLVSQIQGDPDRDELSIGTVPVMDISGKLLFFLLLFAGVMFDAILNTFFPLLSRVLPLCDIPASLRDVDIIPVIVLWFSHVPPPKIPATASKLCLEGSTLSWGQLG